MADAPKPAPAQPPAPAPAAAAPSPVPAPAPDMATMTVTTSTGIPMRHRAWAKVEAGKVTELGVLPAHMPHPFADHAEKGGAVLDVTGVDCSVGYLADAKGNVTPTEGRTGTIPPGLPAYHGGPGVTSTTANLAAALAGSEPVSDDLAMADTDTTTVQPANRDGHPVHNVDPAPSADAKTPAADGHADAGVVKND